MDLRAVAFRVVTIFREETAFVLARTLRLVALNRVLEVVLAFTEERRRGAFDFPPELAFFRFTAARFMTDYWLRLGFLLGPCNVNSRWKLSLRWILQPTADTTHSIRKGLHEPISTSCN